MMRLSYVSVLLLLLSSPLHGAPWGWFGRDTSTSNATATGTKVPTVPSQQQISQWGEARAKAAQDRAAFLRSNVNNLPELAKFAANGPLIVMSIFNAAYHQMAANWYYSLYRFGSVKEVLLAAHDALSLERCLTLGLVCWNATPLLPEAQGAIPHHEVKHGDSDRHYFRFMWTKPYCMRAVLQLNYTLLYSDLDTVWTKDAARSMLVGGADHHDADMAGMEDLPPGSGRPNAGNLLLKSNPRVLTMLDRWLDRALDEGALRADMHDQDGLMQIKEKFWTGCRDVASCTAVKALGQAAVWLHPWHGCPWDHHRDLKTNLCGKQYGYLHIFCTASGLAHKMTMAKEAGLWFVKPEPVLALGQQHPIAIDMIDYKDKHWVREGPDGYTLPCADEVAWLDR